MPQFAITNLNGDAIFMHLVDANQGKLEYLLSFTSVTMEKIHLRIPK